MDPSVRRRKRKNGEGGVLLLDMHETWQLLPGRKIVPERIRENRAPYYAGLEAADRAWDEGKLDVSVMAKYLEELLKGQLTDK
ncbi:MAG: hypothetical protein L0Z53_25480 [Acidobacteriales bacterium]|nr:hypothetical protein [Terriglobales bacterium]